MPDQEPAMSQSAPLCRPFRPAFARRLAPVVAGMAVAAPLLALTAVAQARAPDCAALARQALPDTTFTTVETVAAGSWQPPQDQLSRIMSAPGMNLAGHARQAANPAFCRVAATLRPSPDSQIRTEIWLPLSGWNGKLLGVGNFGWAGSLMYYGMATGVAEGYAVASTDTGHDSATPEGQGGRFTLGHPEKMIDYAYRADHLMTVTARKLVRAFYGKKPAHAYWIGCSLGGLEGLIEAKRYPEDYDGIVAGAPPNPIVNFNAEQLWSGWMSYHDPALRVSRDKFHLLNAAVMNACASPVGKKQGFLDEPDRCAFTPEQLECKGGDTTKCLTANEVRAARNIYQGPVDPQTHQVIFPGPAKGSEDGFSADGRAFPVALDLFRYAAFQNPDWDWTTLNWGTDIQEATRRVGPLLHVDDNLTPFLRRGGRLLLYIGWNDGHNPEQLASYYQAVQRNAGPVGADAVRLITIPGMGHCQGGAGCDTFSKLGVIDDWVSHGHAPEQVIAARVENGQVVRTRPLCAWPKVARHDGHGSMDDAASFACVDPAGQ
ncbi:tannase/feruloyl esterase family alpha/beta hydrolase [Komagataeibacter rhaeticus]|uniref:tannase/feruloyl esterase family alpha/beta hydrolase n=1 Tax=Komagataeibacter rhaeticus TaxID=215221 RepID=UPI0039ECE492